MTRGQEKPMRRSTSDQRGFTIIEMLVIIGIITILLAMLLPALSGVQNRARKNTEVSHLRQVHLAWMSYANENNDAAVPGYLDEDVQERWRIRIEFPYDPEDVDQDGSGGSDDPGVGGAGSSGGSYLASGPVARQGGSPDDPASIDETGATWTWRLLPYLDYAFDSVLGYDDAADRTTREMVVRRKFIARHPAFGYNGLYVGGRWQIVDGRPQYFFTNARASSLDEGSEGARINVVSRTVSQIQRSSEVVIFCSSMRIPSPQLVRKPDDIDPGYHMVTPPIVADQLQWGHDSNAGPSDGQGDLRYITTYATPALVPIGRYNGLVPILRADGSIETNLPFALFDQRIWIDVARTRDFSHTFDSNDADFAQFP